LWSSIHARNGSLDIMAKDKNEGRLHFLSSDGRTINGMWNLHDQPFNNIATERTKPTLSKPALELKHNKSVFKAIVFFTETVETTLEKRP